MSPARHRLVAIGLFVLALLLVGCSKTRQHVEPDGDVVLRTAPTALGWVGIVVPTIIAAVILSLFLAMLVGTLCGEVADAARSRRFLPAAGFLLVLLVTTGGLCLGGWVVATQTVLKYQTTVATASRSADELSITRSRLIGDDEIRRWDYREIDRFQFEYIPGTSGDGGSPPQGFVSVRTADGGEVRIFEGSACPARRLADSLTSATGIPIDVKEGWRDLSSWFALSTQMRCGIAEPFRPTGLPDYPAEVSRVLELGSLASWPWLLPFLASQLILIVALCVVDKRWLEPKAPTELRVAVWVPTVMAVVALHVLAVRSYGSWAPALAILALVLMKVAMMRLGLTLGGMLRRWGTST